LFLESRGGGGREVGVGWGGGYITHVMEGCPGSEATGHQTLREPMPKSETTNVSI
jgi:hypothetical protein